MSKKPLYVSKQGGSIYCFRGDSEWIFRVCSEHLYLYCNDFLTAIKQLKRLERLKSQATKISLKAKRKEGDSLRCLVESAAAPFLEKEAA